MAEVILKDQKARVCFRDIRVISVFPYGGVTVGKFSKYWGNAIWQNLYFPALAIDRPQKKDLYRAKGDITIGGTNLTAGTILDTEALDTWHKPAWQSVYTKLEQNFTNCFLGLSFDYLLNKNYTTKQAKCAIEWSCTALANVTLYGLCACVFNPAVVQYSLTDDAPILGLAGASYLYVMDNFSAIFAAECFMRNAHFGYACRISPVFFDDTTLFFEMHHLIKKEYRLVVSVLFNIKELDIRLEYISSNFLKKHENGSVFTVEVVYAYG